MCSSTARDMGPLLLLKTDRDCNACTHPDGTPHPSLFADIQESGPTSACAMPARTLNPK